MERFIRFGKLKGNIYTFVSLFVILPILLLQYSGLLQPWELALYDALFWLKPSETVDENIVIVEWDERSIRQLSEPIISDRTLAEALDKIIQQKPRVIGLDLYRDLPVPAYKLSKQENQAAYKFLINILANNREIIGIKKTIEPTVSPSQILEQKERVTASDLPADSDFRVRRAYIFPYTDDRDPGTGIGVPYVGVVLGYKFLEQEGWGADNASNGIKFYRQNKHFTLKAIPKNSYLFEDSGLDFLVNWRVTKNQPSFTRVSIIDLIDNKTLPSTFEDCLVVVGNTTSYSGDIHNTSISRWKPRESTINEQWTEGVNIVAHVASSIIRAAINDRNLISITPQWLEMLLLFVTVFGLAKLSNKYFLDHKTFMTVQWATLFCSIGLITVLLLIGRCLFNIYGVWLNIVPSGLAIIWSWIALTSYFQSKKEQRDFNYLKLLIRDFKHNIGSVSAHIASCNRGIVRYVNDVKSQLLNEYRELGIDDDEFNSTEYYHQLKSIEKRTNAIQFEISRINNYQKRTSDFLEHVYSSNNSHSLKAVDVNQIVFATAQNCINQQKSKTKPRLIEKRDERIPLLKIRSEYLPIIVENLVTNACYAVSSNNSNNSPWIKVGTKNHRRFIELYVEDNGIGMTQAQQKEVFMPFIFFRPDGQGIGLSLVAQIINSFSGSIKLKSKISQGSKFSLKIPKH